MEKLRIGLVTDIHAGRTRSNISSDEALSLLDGVVEGANARSVDLFVTLGDNVNATNETEDSENLQRVRDSLDRIAAPVVPLFGNNEFKFAGRSVSATALRCEAGSEVRQVAGWHLVLWRPDCDASLESGLQLSAADLTWLERALANASYPAVLFLHAPIDGQSMVGNYYFEDRPDLAGYVNAAQARSVIEASGKVVLVLTGHVHWHAGSTIDGVHYRTLPSLADTFNTDGVASGAWAVLDLAADAMTLEVFGREPLQWRVVPRAPGTHWRKPMGRAAFESRMRALWTGDTT